MKAIIKFEIEFESWFDDDREPKTKEEWADFFMEYFATDSGIIGEERGDYQDMVEIERFTTECLEVQKGSKP